MVLSYPLSYDSPFLTGAVEPVPLSDINIHLADLLLADMASGHELDIPAEAAGAAGADVDVFEARST